MIADSDGFNPQNVVRSHEPLLSPAWSADGRRLGGVEGGPAQPGQTDGELATSM
jgi:TolB protein